MYQSYETGNEWHQSLPSRWKPIDDVDDFTYLGNIVTNSGGKEEEVQDKVNKARNAFGILRNIWKLVSTKMSVLLNGSETWKTSKSIP